MRKGLGPLIIIVVAVVLIAAVGVYLWCTGKDNQTDQILLDQIGTQSQAGIIGSNNRIHTEKILLGNYLWSLSQVGTYENLKRSMWNEESYEELGEWKDDNGVYWRKFDETNIPSEEEVFADVTSYIDERFRPDKFKHTKDFVIEHQNNGKGITMDAVFNVENSYKSRRIEAELHGADDLTQDSASRLFYLLHNSKSVAENSESFIDYYMWWNMNEHPNHACKDGPDPSDIGLAALDADLEKALLGLEGSIGTKFLNSWWLETEIVPGSTSYTTRMVNHPQGCSEQVTQADAEGNSQTVTVYSDARDRSYTYEYTVRITMIDLRTRLLTEEGLKPYSVTFLIKNSMEYDHPSGVPYPAPNYDSFKN